MKRNQMTINGRYERIDNIEIKQDQEGYYIEKWDGKNIFDITKNKIYLTKDEMVEYFRILAHNELADRKEKKIEEAKKHGRVKKIPQYINKKNKPVAMMMIYYDEEGRVIS